MSSTASTRSSGSDHVLSYHSPSSNTSLFDDMSDIDGEGFLNSQRRAGGPYLCSLPAFRQGLNRNYSANKNLLMNSTKIQHDVQDILDRNFIQYKEVTLIGRRAKVDPERWPVPTIIIVAKRQSAAENWREMTKIIYNYSKTYLAGIRIEMIDEEIDKPLRCFPILRTDAIRDKWLHICQLIISLFDILDWTALGCWRYGWGSTAEENDPTIIVSIRKDSTKQFHTDTQRIKGILAHYGVRGMSILFHKDEIKSHSGPHSLSQDACSQEAKPGGSLGIMNSSAGSSTLGGLVELQYPGDSTWHRLGITCFHCVYPPIHHRQSMNLDEDAQKMLQKWELNVCEKDTATHILKLEHPSVYDINETLKKTRNTIAIYKDEDYHNLMTRMKALQKAFMDGKEDDEDLDEVFLTERELQRYLRKQKYIEKLEEKTHHFENFVDNNSFYLGGVYAGSGLYRVKKRANHTMYCMDWALISITPERLGGNKPLELSGPGVNLDEDTTFGPAVQTLDDIEVPLLKCGRSTRITSGTYSEILEAKICRKYDEHGQLVPEVTFEHAVTSAMKGTFAEPGDSGSFVFTEDGGVVGLFMGGFERKDVFYFSYIEDVFEDIKVVTGAKEVRIA